MARERAQRARGTGMDAGHGGHDVCSSVTIFVVVGDTGLPQVSGSLESLASR